MLESEHLLTEHAFAKSQLFCVSQSDACTPPVFGDLSPVQRGSLASSAGLSGNYRRFDVVQRVNKSVPQGEALSSDDVIADLESNHSKTLAKS